MLKNLNKIGLLFILISLLALLRAYEGFLFYDPFLNYFKIDYTNLDLPKVDYFQLFMGLFFRYFLNTIISLSILYVIFKDLEIIKFVTLLYVIFFIIITAIFFFVLNFYGEDNKMTLFYIRRFLIQPIFLMLFIPAFYYQKYGK